LYFDKNIVNNPPLDPFSKLPILPDGLAYDPQLKLPIDPETGYPFDKQRNTHIDPKTKQPV